MSATCPFCPNSSEQRPDRSYFKPYGPLVKVQIVNVSCRLFIQVRPPEFELRQCCSTLHFMFSLCQSSSFCMRNRLRIGCSHCCFQSLCFMCMSVRHTILHSFYYEQYHLAIIYDRHRTIPMARAPSRI